MRRLFPISAAFALSGTPVLAASGPFFSLNNTNFVVSIAFLLFIAVLLYYKVPGILAGMLDKRADTIRAELDEAKALREEAQAVLASYERKQKEVAEQAERIVKYARGEATAAAEEAKEELKRSIARRLQAAEDQIASAENAAVRDVRDRAVAVAVAAARDVIARQMSADQANGLIDDAIGEVEKKLH
ncbi:ATP F0F1 synthase subunit B [Maritimibacter sp. 55A14]|uniref:F0F1 ATP synthase subunit B n=1 Tax=Maritimibacter sp. 55A14 TaxID=2174844 RepID=UPI000D6047EC|nr:F0F1 ATP synthase subunit B [Maritimibacter sp. 55A14]PWE32236.1 ATP F0F1 synthase subunit B [Maritimibacter sp. 55A14]